MGWRIERKSTKEACAEKKQRRIEASTSEVKMDTGSASKRAGGEELGEEKRARVDAEGEDKEMKQSDVDTPMDSSALDMEAVDLLPL